MGKLGEMTIQALRVRGAKSDMETLLKTPIKELPGPLAVNSSILGETIYLCPNDEAAREVEAKGGVAYTPGEIAALSKASETRAQEEWGFFLKPLHWAKKTFLGSRIQA